MTSEQGWLAMTKARHLGPDASEMLCVHRGNGHSRADTCISQDSSPRVDDEGMAMTLSAPIVQPGLGWRQHIGRVFNGPGLQQHLPMVLSGSGRGPKQGR